MCTIHSRLLNNHKRVLHNGEVLNLVERIIFFERAGHPPQLSTNLLVQKQDHLEKNANNIAYKRSKTR